MSKTKLSLISVLSILLILIGGYFVHRTYFSSHNTAKLSPQAKNINLQPPTAADKSSVDQHKNALSQQIQQQNDTKTKPTNVSVTPIIVDASQYDQKIEVRSYVSGIYETGGTCTITFTKGSSQIIKSVPAEEDATTVRCTNLDVSRTEFSAGTWSVKVFYSSPSASGTSTAKTLEVV